MQEIFIKTEFIKLNQLLKLAGVLDQGSDIRVMLSEKLIKLNGDFVSERGKKIRNGDIVEVLGFGKIIVKEKLI